MGIHLNVGFMEGLNKTISRKLTDDKIEEVSNALRTSTQWVRGCKGGIECVNVETAIKLCDILNILLDFSVDDGE